MAQIQERDALLDAARDHGHDMSTFHPQPETGLPMACCLLPGCDAWIVLGPRFESTGQLLRNDTQAPCWGSDEFADEERD